MNAERYLPDGDQNEVVRILIRENRPLRLVAYNELGDLKNSGVTNGLDRIINFANVHYSLEVAVYYCFCENSDLRAKLIKYKDLARSDCFVILLGIINDVIPLQIDELLRHEIFTAAINLRSQDKDKLSLPRIVESVNGEVVNISFRGPRTTLVADISSGIFLFHFCHELGHVLHGHTSLILEDGNLPKAAFRYFEREADVFASLFIQMVIAGGFWVWPCSGQDAHLRSLRYIMACLAIENLVVGGEAILTPDAVDEDASHPPMRARMMSILDCLARFAEPFTQLTMSEILHSHLGPTLQAVMRLSAVSRRRSEEEERLFNLEPHFLNKLRIKTRAWGLENEHRLHRHRLIQPYEILGGRKRNIEGTVT